MCHIILIEKIIYMGSGAYKAYKYAKRKNTNIL